MEQLPSSLLFFTTQIANFTRNTVKVNSLNQTTLSSDGVTQIRLALPVNALLNMKSLSMHGDVSTQNKGSGTDHVLIPKGGIGAMLDRVTWAAGGISLDNGPVPYHVIQAVKENLEKGTQKHLSDDRVLAQAQIEDRTVSVNPAAGSQGQVKALVQNNFLGFTECHPTYLDMSLLPECFCTIQAAPAWVLPVQPADGNLGEDPDGNNLNAQYSIDNIFFTVEVCQMGSGMYDALVQRRLMEQGSLDVPYPQYQVFSRTTEGGVQDIRGSVSCMSLDRIYATSRARNYTQSAAPVRCEDAIGSAFQQRAVNFAAYDTAEWQFQLNNAPLPMYRATSIDAYNYAVCAEDRTYSEHRGSLVSSQGEWFNNKWVATQRLSLDNSPTRLSGTNLSSINAQVVYSPVGGRANPTPALPPGGEGNVAGLEMMLITKQTSILRIGQSRACAVVA